MGRVILAGIVAGVALFIWGFVEHTATPIGTMGIQSHPHEAMLVPVIQQTATRPGLYAFPGYDTSHKLTKEEETEWIERYKAGPHGMLIVGQNGADPVSPMRLVIELLSNIVTATLAACLLAKLAGGLAGFVSGGILVFLIGWLSISLPSWNWFDFPALFVAAELIDQIVAGALVGLVAGLFLRRSRA